MKEHLYLTKALNYWKRTNITTYLGIRALLDLKTNKYNWLDSIINRKSVVNKTIALNPYLLYKDKENEIFDYRNCFSLSPLNALIESRVIEILKKYSNNHPSCVYSYQPAYHKAGHHFRYFYSSYKKRNILISDLLQKNTDLIINVFDLKKYYPSIDKSKVVYKINSIISKADNTEKEIVLNWINNLFNNVNQGIPIGPAISCFLGTIVLDDVDNKLYEKYGDCYFRYVDDIIIISKKEQISEVKQYINFVVKENGFSTNEKKYSVGFSSDWFKYNSYFSDNSYNKFLIRLRLYLIRHQNEFNIVREKFIEKGFCLPFYKFKCDIKNVHYKNWLKRFIKESKYWLFYRFDNVNKLLNEAINIRENIFSELNNYIVEYTPHNKFQKRWFNQRINFFFNRLIYLYNKDYYSDIYKVLEKHIDEDKKNFFLSVINNDFSEIIKYPGQVIAILSSYFKENNKKILISEMNIDKNDNFEAIKNSLLILSCYGVIFDDIEYLKENNLDLINLFFRNDKGERINNDFSFIDEMSSLFLNKSIDDIQLYHESHFSDEEEMFFEVDYSKGSSYL
ncbi:RNA-directed DNA polymerase [Candidatus Gracilibacteria bacterium]|nr:RNA-directed DNA polymerase [Candidatus Gracilibacteria bacterium]